MVLKLRRLLVKILIDVRNSRRTMPFKCIEIVFEVNLYGVYGRGALGVDSTLTLRRFLADTGRFRRRFGTRIVHRLDVVSNGLGQMIAHAQTVTQKRVYGVF